MYNGLIISKRLTTVLLPSKTKKNTSRSAMKTELKVFSRRYWTNPWGYPEHRKHLRNVHLTQNRFYSRKIDMSYKRREIKVVYIELRWKSDNTWFFYLQLYSRIFYDSARTSGWQNSVYIKSTFGYKKQGWLLKCRWFKTSPWEKSRPRLDTQSSLVDTKYS